MPTICYCHYVIIVSASVSRKASSYRQRHVTCARNLVFCLADNYVTHSSVIDPHAQGASCNGDVHLSVCLSVRLFVCRVAAAYQGCPI